MSQCSWSSTFGISAPCDHPCFDLPWPLSTAWERPRGWEVGLLHCLTVALADGFRATVSLYMNINVVLFLLILLALHVPESNLRFTLTRIAMHMTLLSVSLDHENRESTEFPKLSKSTVWGTDTFSSFCLHFLRLAQGTDKACLEKHFLDADCTDVLFFQIQLWVRREILWLP